MMTLGSMHTALGRSTSSGGYIPVVDGIRCVANRSGNSRVLPRLQNRQTDVSSVIFENDQRDF